MAKRVGQKVKLSSIDELLGVPSTEGTVDLDVNAIYPFENHPFRVVDDEKMDELVSSIEESGVLTPVLVRPDDEGTYEMISGHRRLHAAKRAGLAKIPAIIKEMTNDDATIAMVNANMQREEILPSEKAFAFRMKLEAIKHQGARRSTSPHDGAKLVAADIVGEASGVSGSQVSRLIRLTELIPNFLNMVDDKHLPLAVGVEISFLNKTYQQWLYEYIQLNGMVKQEQLMELRPYREDETLSREQFFELLDSSRAVPVTNARKKVIIPEKVLRTFFPAYYSQAEVEKTIFSLLDQWKREHEGEENQQ